MKDLRIKIHKLSFYEFLPPSLKKQYKFISNYLKKYTKRAYVVGGGVRDYINNTSIYDIDIEVYDISLKKFDEIMKNINAKSVGKSFFVYKYKDVDIALARSEKQISNHHRGFDVVQENDEKKASIRRDFRMNSIMLNIFTNKILDNFNGIKDIQNKQLSIIDERRFKEDSLRVLRAVQFCARFDFRCDKYTTKVMQNIDISNISNARIFTELEKLFLAKYLHIGFFYSYKLNILYKIFGIKIDFFQFMNIYKILKNTILDKHNTNNKFYFLYIIFSILKIDRIEFFKKNIFPNIYKRNLLTQKYIPKHITSKFLIALSLKYPLFKWIASCQKHITIKAKKLNIYEKSFMPKTTIADIINDGYIKEDIKKRFYKLAYKEIKNIK